MHKERSEKRREEKRCICARIVTLHCKVELNRNGNLFNTVVLEYNLLRF